MASRPQLSLAHCRRPGPSHEGDPQERLLRPWPSAFRPAPGVCRPQNRRGPKPGAGYGANAYIGAIAISPNYRKDKRIIIIFRRGLFESVNGGISFHPINTNLIENNHAVTRIQFSPAYATDKTIYSASEEKLFRSTDGGDTWEVIKVPIRYEDRNDYISYDEHWERLRGEDFSAMTASHSDIAKSKAMFNFVGTGVKWIGTKSNSQGIAKVYIDGEFKATVDQFSDNRDVMVTSYRATNLLHSNHSIIIELTGAKNPKSTGSRVELDAFDVLP